MAEKYITKSELDSAIEDLCKKYNISYGEESLGFGRELAGLSDRLPSADVHSEKHGRWIYQKPNANFCGANDDFIDCVATDFGVSADKIRQIVSLLHQWRCSRCGKLSRRAKYCHNCGAKMDGEDGEQE